MSEHKTKHKIKVGRLLLTEQSIHGLVLVAGMIVISRNLAGTSLDTLLTVFMTMLIFFAGHVYSETVARLALPDNKNSVIQSIFLAIKHSSGLIIISLIPIGVLALGVSHLVEDDHAVWLALITDAALLAAVGWLIVAKKTTNFWHRLGGALITASFGMALIALKVFFYH